MRPTLSPSGGLWPERGSGTTAPEREERDMDDADETDESTHPSRRRLSDVNRAQRAEWAADLVRLRPDAKPTVEVYEEHGIARMVRGYDSNGEALTVVFTVKEWQAITLAVLDQFGLAPITDARK